MRKAALLAAALAALATPAFAWNNHGHMVVAAVAWEELTPRARQRAGALLAFNPSYPEWTAGVPDADKARVAFLRAATWPDAIRAAPGYQRDEIAASGPLASRNIGYADTLVHPYWHYRDEPFSPDGTALKPPEVPNAQTQIRAFRRTLRSKAPDAVKAYDLVWLEHLVGDVHQPLHATARFTHDGLDGDRGGNSVKLCDTPGCRDNLHSLWDGALGRNDTVEAATAAAQALPRAPDAQARVRDERAWLAESFTIAQGSVYAGPIGPALGPYTATEAYRQTAREVARGRVALAGRRLAALINHELR